MENQEIKLATGEDSLIECLDGSNFLKGLRNIGWSGYMGNRQLKIRILCYVVTERCLWIIKRDMGIAISRWVLQCVLLLTK